MSQPSRDPLAVRLSLAILRAVRYLVPPAARDAWMREWEAEIRCRWQGMNRREQPQWHEQATLVRRSSGAVADAAWLRRQFTADLHAVQDVRYAWRMLRARPYASTFAVLVLALGIGGTVTVFSTVDTLLLRELPYRNSARIVTIWQTPASDPDDREGVSPGAFFDWQARTTSYAALAAVEPWSFDYLEGPEPTELVGALVTEGFFEALGVQPARGRLFRPEEYADGGSDVVLLGYGAWQRRFGGDETIVGRTVRLQGRPHLIAGVLPQWFHPDVIRRAKEQEVWAPQTIQEFERTNRRNRFWSVVGRLAPGVTVERAQAEITTVSAQLAVEYPRTLGGMTATVEPLRRYLAGPVREPLTLLLAAVVMVLLIACANVANLMLARSMARQREFAVRAAIGAARWRLVRQILVESAVLSALACGIGLALASIAIRGFVGFTSGLVRQLAEVTIDTRLVLFAVALAALTTVLVGVWPALQLSRGGVHTGLKETSAGLTAGTHRRRFASSLIVGEVAIAFTLLIGAGLLVRSFTTLAQVDPGFEKTDVAVLQVFAYGPRYQTDAQRLAFFERTLERFRGVPGVVRAGLSTVTPFLPSQIDIQGGFRVEGRTAPPDAELPVTTLTVATSDFFHALRIPLRRGRLFADTDHAGAPLVALVNEVMAERVWPGGNPVGHRLTANWQGQWRTMEIVGVVGRVRHRRLEGEPTPEVFMPAQQLPYGSMTFVVQTARDPAALMPALKAHVWEGDPTLPLYEAATLDSLVEASLAPRRFVMTVTSALSGIAFVLAALGIYGMLSFSTAQRTREIGLRMAMGGSPRHVVTMVMKEGMRFVAAGLMLGMGATLLLSRGIGALLYGVSPTDPITLAGTTALLGAVALVACYLPARRAVRIDPLEALRSS